MNVVYCTRLALFLTVSLGFIVPANAMPRDTAFSKPQHSWSVGIFNPLRYQLSEDWAIEGHPLVELAHPHATVDHTWARGERWALTGRYGLSVPSFSLRFGIPFGLKGYLSPTCAVSEAEPDRNLDCGQRAWALAPLIGARYSWGRTWVVTTEVDVAVGLILSGHRPLPLDTYAPLDLVYAPLTRTHRTHFGMRVGRQIQPWLTLSADMNIYIMGGTGGRSPWTVSGYIGADFHVTAHLTMTVGGMYFNHDQRAMELVTDSDGFSRKEWRRNHDLYPTIDLIWSY